MVSIWKPRLSTMDTRTVKPLPKTADAELKTREHVYWSRAVIGRADYRCEALEADGSRCRITRPARLFADHIIERRDGGDLLDPENGQCLCGRHHTLKTGKARANRMAERFDHG